MEITVIKQGNFKVDANKNFAFLTPNEVYKGIKLAIQPFLITTPNDVVLLDAGLNILEDNEPLILKRLAENNIDPNKITKILLSHLHKDHSGGLGYVKEKEFVQNFPNAVIYIQQCEYEYARQTESKSYDKPFLSALKNLPNIVWLNEDEGEISNEISFQVTGAHSKYHQVFWMKTEDYVVFYGADDLPTKGHLTQHIAFKTDFDGHKAMELRKIWEQQAEESHWQVLLYHDMKEAVLQF